MSKTTIVSHPDNGALIFTDFEDALLYGLDWEMENQEDGLIATTFTDLNAWPPVYCVGIIDPESGEPVGFLGPLV
jgi:hypothetical protein